MRNFNYFYYDSYSSEDVKNYIDDPRNTLNSTTDFIISEIVNSVVNYTSKYSYDTKKIISKQKNKNIIDKLIYLGVLKEQEEKILFDCPIIIKEDLSVLHKLFEIEIQNIIHKIESDIEDIYKIILKIENGFSKEENLYNILCGLIFDGNLFEYLLEKGVIATSRINKSKLDYIPIIYEKNNELEQFSNNLICSFNRYSNGNISLMSFGNARGDRNDFFRVTRNLIIGNNKTQSLIIEELNNDLIRNGYTIEDYKEIILKETKTMIENSNSKINPITLKYLRKFNYLDENGKFIVPIYRNLDFKIIRELEDFIKEIIGNDIVIALKNIDSNLFAMKNRVAVKEIQNELYHILFGKINLKLIEKCIVNKPKDYGIEGSYKKFIICN